MAEEPEKADALQNAGQIVEGEEIGACSARRAQTTGSRPTRMPRLVELKPAAALPAGHHSRRFR